METISFHEFQDYPSFPETDQVLQDIQTAMQLVWKPTNWHWYSSHPTLMKILWTQIKPAVTTERFYQDTSEIRKYTYFDVIRWYEWHHDWTPSQEEQEQLLKEVQSLTFGNSQLIIHQSILSRALKGEVLGWDSPFHPPQKSNFAKPKTAVRVLEEGEAPVKTKRIFKEIRQEYSLPMVPTDFQAIAKWPEFLRYTWQDLHKARARKEFQALKTKLMQWAHQATDQLCSLVHIDEHMLMASLDSPDELGTFLQLVDKMNDLIPEMVISNALQRMAITEKLS